jgi:hypothetical protein
MLVKNIYNHLQQYDTITVFAGRDFVSVISEACPESKIITPLKGLGIGQRLKFLTDAML